MPIPFTIEEVKLALQGIATLSGLVSASKAALDIGKLLTEDEIEQIKQSAPEISDEIAKDFLSKIEQRILEPLIDNINGQIEEVARASRDKSLSNAERQRISDKAQAQICFELRQMKQFNGGVLPDIENPDLYRLWNENRCY